jgi:hypothetical protein
VLQSGRTEAHYRLRNPQDVPFVFVMFIKQNGRLGDLSLTKHNFFI